MEAKLAAASERAQMQGEEVDRYFAKTLALNAALRDCQAALKQAEQKVEILLQKSATAAAEPFEPDDA